jgi:HlyD family secretion protein
VPSTALFRDGEAWYVMAVADGRAVRRPVGIGHRGDRCTEVLSGLDEGTRVVRYPDNRIAAGTPIEVG